MHASSLRAEYPALQTLAYLNTGTNGPLSAKAAEAATGELQRQLRDGRAHAYFEHKKELSAELRAAYAAVLGCDTADLALTTSTSEGLAQVLSGLALGPGDEILTSDEEHPGLLGALGAARELHGVSVREAPMRELAEAVTAKTTLVACSHVGWASGLIAPRELAALDVALVLDGAQGVGAVPVDLRALGCDAYAGAGQKWLCGPDGTGMLYVSAELRERIAVTRRGYGNLEDANVGLDAVPQPDARRFDAMSMSGEALACARAAVGVLQAAGLDAVQARARELAAGLAERLRELGREVAPRDDTTLVSFTSPDPERERLELAERGVIVRNIPARPWLRASVGGWNSEADLDRLLEAL